MRAQKKATLGVQNKKTGRPKSNPALSGDNLSKLGASLFYQSF